MTIGYTRLLLFVSVFCALRAQAAHYQSSNSVLGEGQDLPATLGRDSVQFLRHTPNRTVDGEIHLKHKASKPKDLLPGASHASERLGEQFDKVNPWSQEHNDIDYLKCGVTHKAGSTNDKYELCPAECQYFAQNRDDDDFCTFICVPGDECGKWNPHKPIPGHIKDSYSCRGPVVQFCKELTLDGKDTCSKCQYGWSVWQIADGGDGQCYFTYWKTIYSVGAALLVIVLVLVAYVTDWCLRPTINQKGVTEGQKYRSQCKNLVPKDRLEVFYPGEGKTHRCPYPETTNLCREDVAGPGMLLHFNFQALLILWPLFVGLTWTAFACFHNELFVIGTRRFGTPRHNCILVAWGWETQHALMWTKILFLAIVYVGSFVGFMVFGVRQYRMYQEMDAMEKTMKDFVIEIEGLPRVLGAPSVESDIQKALEKAGCKNIVGVSVAWDFFDNADDIMNEVYADLVDKEVEINKGLTDDDGLPRRPRAELRRKPMDAANPRSKKVTVLKIGDTEEILPPEDLGPMRKFMYETEMALVGPSAPADDDPDHPDPDFDPLYSPDPLSENTASDPDKTKTALTKLYSSENAFVVFDTQEDRDAVVDNKTVLENLKTQSYTIAGQEYNRPLKLTLVNCEPTTVNWQNYGDSSCCGMLKRFCKGFCCVYIPALAIWFFVFYVPYAYSLYNFNYDNGAELPSYYGLLFTIIVVGGNATMYFVCDQVGEVIGFRYKDTKQVAYMLMYLAACTLNVVLDMVVTYYTALQTMIGLDFRDYAGTKIEEYTSFTATFETYAMQRSLAENVKLYAFPSTFLIPFLIEPIVTVWVPYRLGRLIVRTHKEVQGRCAEAYYAPFDFDLGRYADILLNVFLGILIFWFPGGYINLLFFGMAGSHMWIYLFDHWKVLNAIPSIKIVSKEVDSWGQLVLAGLTGMILSALVFKSNCQLGQFNLPEYCLTGNDIILSTVIAGLAHFALHLILLFTLVPALGMGEDQLDQLAKEFQTDGRRFKDIAEDEAFTWFSANPVHCLRSKYVHGHQPYCRFASVGKEHLLEVNEKIGCYFKDEEGEVEVFDEASLAKTFSKGGKEFFKKAYSKFRGTESPTVSPRTISPRIKSQQPPSKPE